MPDIPFILRPSQYKDASEKSKKENKELVDVLRAQAQQGYDVPKKKKSLFGKALKITSGFVPNPVEDVAKGIGGAIKSTGKATMSGLETYGGQVQSVPAALFTRGTVEDGQYTTRRNIIGNPLSNISSHVAAQREAGLIDEPSGVLDTITEGFKAANRAGRAYSEDPDIPAGVKFGTGVLADPTTYIGAGLISKTPKLAAKGGLSGKFLRGSLGVVEGFDKPSTALKFTAGGALGTELASRKNIPGVPEAVEQISGGLLGGAAGIGIGARGVRQSLKDVDTLGAKLQGRQGRGMAIGAMIEKYGPGEFPTKPYLDAEVDRLKAKRHRASLTTEEDFYLEEIENIRNNYDELKRIHEAVKGDQDIYLSDRNKLASRAREIEKELDDLSTKYEGNYTKDAQWLKDYERTNVLIKELSDINSEIISRNDQVRSLSYEEAAEKNKYDFSNYSDEELARDVRELTDRVNDNTRGTAAYLEDRGRLQRFNTEAERRGINPADFMDTVQRTEVSTGFEKLPYEESSLDEINSEIANLWELKRQNNLSEYGEKSLENLIRRRATLQSRGQTSAVSPVKSGGVRAGDVGAGEIPTWIKEADIEDINKRRESLRKLREEGNLTDSGYKELSQLSRELRQREWDNRKNVSGGAFPETLVTPREITVGLTKGEKVSNALIKIKKFLVQHGVENDATATPIAREYLRINNIVKTQATNIGKLAHRAERMLNIDNIMEADLRNLTPEQTQVVEQLRRSMEAYDETLKQFDTDFEDIHSFYEKVRYEQGYENKKFSDIYTEYGNAIANKVSDKWMADQIKNLGENVELANELGAGIPSRTVNLAGAGDVKLPRQIGDVLANAVSKVHPTKDKEYTELFNAVNNTLRGMWAAGDASFQMIQMLPTWADNPKLALKVTRAGFKTLKDPTVFADFALKHDAAAYGTRPTITKWVENGLHIAHATGEGTDVGGLSGNIQRVKGYGAFLKKSNTLFTESGNFNRVGLADYLYDNYKQGGIPMVSKLGIKEGMTEKEILTRIASAANRATGYSPHAFGGAYGSALFFAPRFMQSQLEMIMKAAWGGDIENQVARRQLLKLIALGSAITVAANEAGEILHGNASLNPKDWDTDFDPRSSNFMRIRNVGGVDISVFGPWDTLVKGLVRSVPHPTADGDFTLGEPDYLFRSKLSPVLSTTLSFILGENVVGESSRDFTAVKNLLLPFSLQDISGNPLDWDKQTAVETGIGLLGGKGSPLSNTEVLESRLESAGIKKSDPDYLIKRRQYLADHPEQVPSSEDKTFKRGQEIRENISERRKANETLTISSGQTLVDFREKRKLLLTEQRNRQDEIFKGDFKKASSQQQKWLNSYFDLFDDEGNQDPITLELNPDKFDESVAAWTVKNSPEALQFVQRYLGTGLGPVETAYYNDLQKLQQSGYFDLPKYQKMKSGLSEDEIDSLAAIVDSFRVSNPDLQSQAWATTAKRLLGDSLDSAELLDILHSRKQSYANPEREKLKQQFGKELLWFNPRADWKAYTNYTPGKGTKVGGALKKSIKPQIK